MTFDPYADCLGIRPEERPVDFYRLLGVPRFEQDLNRIASAADDRVSLLHQRRTMENAAQIQHVLNEIGEAKRWLLDLRQKTNYDHQLRAMQPVRSSNAPQETPLGSPGQYLNPPKFPAGGAVESQLPSPPVPGFPHNKEQPLPAPRPIRQVPTPSSTQPSEFPLASPLVPGSIASQSSMSDDAQIAVPRGAPPSHIPSLQEIAARNATQNASGIQRPVGFGSSSPANPIMSPPAPHSVSPIGGGHSPQTQLGGIGDSHAQPPEPTPPEAAPPMQGFGIGLPPLSVASPPPNAPPADVSSDNSPLVRSTYRGKSRPLGFPLWVPIAGMVALMLVLGALLGLGLTLTGAKDDRDSHANRNTPAADPSNGESNASSSTKADNSTLTASQRRDRIKQQLAEQARREERNRLARTSDGRIIDPALGVVKKPPEEVADSVDPLDRVVGGTIDDPASEPVLVRVALPETSLVNSARASLKDRLAAAQPVDLLQDAFRETTSLQDRFVMLDAARRRAARQGDATLALRAVDALHRQFEIDPVNMKIDTLRGMRDSAGTPAAYSVVVEGALQLADTVEDDTDRQAFQRTLSEALIAARRSGDPDLVRRVTKKLISAERLVPDEPGSDEADTTDNPDNPTDANGANAEAGADPTATDDASAGED